MLIVIFGRGPSYDSRLSPRDGTSPPHWMPLAQQLFDNRPLFNRAMNRDPRSAGKQEAPANRGFFPTTFP
jgi:hypothetical protein